MKNHMEEVAHMLGVELGERFKVKVDGCEVIDVVFYLSEKGLCEENNSDYASDYAYELAYLLTGEWEIVKLPWKPYPNDIFWYINSQGAIDYQRFSPFCSLDLALYKLGKLYRTKEEAQRHLEEDLVFWNMIKEELKE